MLLVLMQVMGAPQSLHSKQNKGNVGHLVEVLWPFKDFANFCSVYLAVFSTNLKTDGVSWKVIEKV